MINHEKNVKTEEKTKEVKRVDDIDDFQIPNEIELSEEDRKILQNPVQLFAIIHRLKKVKRIAPQINRYTFAMQKVIQVVRLLNSFLYDYNIKYNIETLEDKINLNITIGIYSDKTTPKDEYIYTFGILRKAFPELSDTMIHRLTMDVLGRKARFTFTKKDIDDTLYEAIRKANILESNESIENMNIDDTQIQSEGDER